MTFKRNLRWVPLVAVLFATGKRVRVADALLVDFNPGQLNPTPVRIPDASLASQAVGPPLSNIEMSWEGRNFAQLGKKMLSLRPLALQKVSPTDSVLGSLAVIIDPVTLVATELPTGLNTTYEKMIKDAFRPEWWNNKSQTITVNSQAWPPLPPTRRKER